MTGVYTMALCFGAAVAAGINLLTISGPARAVLSGERTALNFVGRLSGVAVTRAANESRSTQSALGSALL